MKLYLSKSTAAFSLTEVLFSMGIIATAILPMLAMLANGSVFQTSSEDRIISSALSESIVDQLRYSPQADGLVLNSAGEEQDEIAMVFPISSGESSTLFLLAERSGKGLRQIDENQFLSGITDAETGRISSLLKIDLKKLPPASSSGRGAAPMYQVQITVEQPIDAKAGNRRAETFSTMISGQK